MLVQELAVERHPKPCHRPFSPPPARARSPATVERVPDPRSLASEDLWDEEWKNNVLELALEKLKARVTTKHFQIFYLQVIKQQSTTKVARALRVSIGQVYLVKHRVKGAFAKAVKQMERDLDARPERKTPAVNPAAVVFV